MLVLFLALIVGPLVAGKYVSGLGKTINKSLGNGKFPLVQPVGQNNNDTLPSPTGDNVNPGLSSKTTGKSKGN